MNIITILEENIKREHQKNWYFILSIEKYLVEERFTWIKLIIDEKSKSLLGKGKLNVGSKNYDIILYYSPFYKSRYDRVFIDDSTIKFNKNIHLYNDMSLCLYHPKIDKPFLSIISLHKMVSWISEWVVYYEQWKKYGIWLGKEIKH